MSSASGVRGEETAARVARREGARVELETRW
jgi:hypothetical protein